MFLNLIHCCVGTFYNGLNLAVLKNTCHIFVGVRKIIPRNHPSWCWLVEVSENSWLVEVSENRAVDISQEEFRNIFLQFSIHPPYPPTPQILCVLAGITMVGRF